MIWLALILQCLSLWTVFASMLVSRDRIKLYVLIDEMPPRAPRAPVWEELVKVSYTRHLALRFFLLNPERLYQSVYAVITVQIVLENLRLDYLRRLWLEKVSP